MKDEWKDLLVSWKVPDPDLELRNGILDFYREQFRGAKSSLWKRVITARIPIPVPVAAVAILLFAAMTYLAVRSRQPEPLRQAIPVSAANQHGALENPRARDSGIVRDPLQNAYSPSKSTSGSSERLQAKAAGGQSTRTPQKVSTITLQGEQETIQLFIGAEYRLIAVPRIYSGTIFNPSEVR